MDEDEAILFLLDLGTGADNVEQDLFDKVEEIQKSCEIEEGDERELKIRLSKSDSVSVDLLLHRLE